MNCFYYNIKISSKEMMKCNHPKTRNFFSLLESEGEDGDKIKLCAYLNLIDICPETFIRIHA